jgi:two-component system chemotaxis response regulator CheY
VLLRSLLEDELGHEVVFAQDGQMAAERFAKIDPELVIADLVMPKMHGVELIKHLRGMYPASNVIAVSGKGQAMLDQAVLAGAVAALPKPLNREDLIAAINRVLRFRDPWKGAE